MRGVSPLTGGVDHEDEPVAEVGDHQVVEDTASLIGEEPVALPAGRQPDHVGRHQRFEGARGLGRIVGA